jgi:nitrile hydratase accessory protein
VRATLTAQPGHTRLPRYVRGHVGIVVGVHGAHIVPDENAQGRSIAEPLYTIAFAVAELFPEQPGHGDKSTLTCGSGTFGRSNGIERLQDEQRPAFNEPWHAEAYALVQVLIEAGRISPPEWAQAFGTALREAGAEGEPDSSDTYYAALSDRRREPSRCRGRATHQRLARCVSSHTSRNAREAHGRLTRDFLPHAEAVVLIVRARPYSWAVAGL